MASTACVPSQLGVSVAYSDVSHFFAQAQIKDPVDPGEPPAGVRALGPVTLSIQPAQLVCLVGPSGCGKTTLLNLTAALEPVQTGTVTINGELPSRGDTRIAYVFARDALLPWRTALDNAELCLELTGVPKAERRERAREALSDLDLGKFERYFPAQLSQGMRQRVALARALAMNPGLLLLDEPFSALDAQTRLAAQDRFLAFWERQKSTVILVTHDLAEAITLGDRVVLMSRSPGQIKSHVYIDLERPRDLRALQRDPRYHAIYDSIWAELADEFLPSHDQVSVPAK